MTSWRERLCGSTVMGDKEAESSASLKQFLNPSSSVSCGGGFFPTLKNVANMQTLRSNIVLPTDQYSVLMFKQDGTAVIYSDSETTGSSEEFEAEEDVGLSKM